MISQIQKGTRTPRLEHAEALDRLFNTPGTLTLLWHNLRQQGTHPEWFRKGALLERIASEIRDYQPLLIPGLLQTPEYAAAVLGYGRRWRGSGETQDELVKTRMERKQIMRDSDGPILWFLVGEECMYRPIGSEKTMADQLRCVAELVDDGVIHLQMVTNQSKTHRSLTAGFRTMAFHDKPPVAFAEYATGELLFQDEKDVRQLNLTFSALQTESLSSDATIAEFRKQIDQYEQRQAD